MESVLSFIYLPILVNPQWARRKTLQNAAAVNKCNRIQPTRIKPNSDQM